MGTFAMNGKQLRKIQATNLALWVFAILLPIVARSFASKDPKIFEVLLPLIQLMLAVASTWMFGVLHSAESKSHQSDVEANSAR
jgi:uncharacterized membrane protein YoaK (UPF0700 family)